MPAATLNLTIEQNADFSRTLTVQDSTGNPVDITGYTFKGQIKSAIGLPKVAELSFQVLPQTTAKGQFVISLAKALVNAIPITPGLAVTPFIYDCFQTTPAGETDKFVTGNVYLIPAVTNE